MADGNSYAALANIAYESRRHNLRGWSVKGWEEGTLFGNGFQGGIYSRATEVVVAFKGTAPGTDTTVQDIWSDLVLGLGGIPDQADAANRLTNTALTIAGERPVSLVGHSLGGALAQVVGVWRALPFVTFNAPGMEAQVHLARGNIFAPGHMIRSWGASTSNARGINFRIDGDPVSAALPAHIGEKVVLPNPGGPDNVHSMNTCARAMAASSWAGRDLGSYLRR